MNQKQKWAAAAAGGAIMVGTVVLFLVLRGCGGPAEPSAPETSGGASQSVVLPDFAALLAQAESQNKDAVAWLYVPGTDINEAVYQAADNEYYLRRGGNKKYSFSGSLFLDYRNKLHPLSQNTIVYGHHIGSPMGAKDDPDGVKFGQLLRFADEEFAQRTPYVWLTVGEETYAFQVFVVAYLEAYLKPVEYHHPDFSPQDWQTLIADLEDRSLYHYPGGAGPDDKILTLSTCVYKYGTYSQNPNQRLIVVGRLVEGGVGAADKADLTVNENPKPPQF